ncbi:MAG: hypothetical protein R2861_12430 [Desulfobacterales bacterium]
MPGMHGTYRANMAISECDLMIAVGVRFDDRVTGKTDEFATHAKIVQIDIDPTSIQKKHPGACAGGGRLQNQPEPRNQMIASRWGIRE